VLGALSLAGAASAADSWAPSFTTTTPAGQNLRGYGRVETEYTGYQAGAKRAWVVNFRCESADKARTLAGKFLGDLTLSPGVAVSELKLTGATASAYTVSGGAAVLVALAGSEARVVGAESSADLIAFLNAHAALAAGAITSAAYPMYLDRFDRYGWGMYGVEDYSGGDWQNYIKQPADDPGPRTPAEDLKWLRDHGFRFDAFMDPSQLGDSDGLMRNSGIDWMAKVTKENNQPMSVRVYNSADLPGWGGRRFPEYLNTLSESSPRYTGSYSLTDSMSWFASDYHRYIGANTASWMKLYADNPNVTGWMHPYGEFNLGGADASDYGPWAQKSWREYLKKQGLDLAAVAGLYGREGSPFGSWEQVMEPEFATFAGLDHQVVPLQGQWWYRIENAPDFSAPADWRGRPVEEKYAGLREKWYQQPVDKQWTQISAPGGTALYNLVMNRYSESASFWFRRTFSMNTGQLAQTPIYLYWFPFSPDAIHSPPTPNYHDVFINGEKAGQIGGWGALDVTRLLHAGDNEVVLHLLGTRWSGRIFLSTEPPAVYPYLGAGKNKLWLLWHQWRADSATEASSLVLDGMRQADPNRPIKFMAPGAMGADNYLKMAYNYGGFPHFTGEGRWFFPWYKRYAYLYGVPGSSETSGPPMEPNLLTDQFNSYRRVFEEGLNAHDPVFVVQWYDRSPVLRQWWESHEPILHQMGKYDMFGPQVILYRSTKQEIGLLSGSPYPPVGNSTRLVQSPWNWDIGRGTLQTIGQSYAYLDDGGLTDGKMNGYPFMFDCGNEVIPDASLDRIEEWVKAGGTYVTLPFSGRDSLEAADSWHITRLTGCEIGKLRPSGQGTVTIKPDQTVFRALAGQTFPDKGSSMDWQNNELNLYSVELKPGPDTEVLATFENGTPAIVRHKLGQGSVIALGTAFWRSSQDIFGVWMVQPRETEFIADLLAGVGYPPAMCVADDRLIWTQPYRSNNGLDLVACLVSWNDDKDVTTTLRLRLPRKPASLICYGVDGVKELPFEWKNGEATTKVFMPAKEVKAVRATGCQDTFDAASYWWSYQQKMWHQLVTPTVDVAAFQQGKWADPTVDLRQGAQLSTSAPADLKWSAPGYDASAWKPCVLSMLNFWGAEPSKPVWVRRSFTVPASWVGQGGQIRLVCAGPIMGNVKLFLNGLQIDDRSRELVDWDVTRQLRDGENVVGWEFSGDRADQGFAGNVYLYRRAPAAASVSLAGDWVGRDLEGKPVTVTLPGTGASTCPVRTVTIPREWQGKYQVRLYMEGARYNISGAWVNGAGIGRMAPYDQPVDWDITNLLHFGEDNTIQLSGMHRNPGDLDNGKLPTWDVITVRLDLFPIEP
jgi:hypothetical protein